MIRRSVGFTVNFNPPFDVHGFTPSGREPMREAMAPSSGSRREPRGGRMACLQRVTDSDAAEPRNEGDGAALDDHDDEMGLPGPADEMEESDI